VEKYAVDVLVNVMLLVTLVVEEVPVATINVHAPVLASAASKSSMGALQ
jgi:hypothetical protein